MSDKVKICNECNTVNEYDYKYCKNCGAGLPQEQENENGGAQSAYNAYNPYTAQAPYMTDEIDGVKTDDLVRFVGSSSDKIVPKFVAMAVGGRKTSWYWPVFILTFLFGLCGAAFWFLYRRMYKWGIALLAASLILSAAKTVVTVNTMEGFIGGYFDAPENYTVNGDDAQLQSDLMTLLTGDELMSASLVSNLFNVGRMAISVLAALFALYIYKNHAVQKIKSFGRPLSDMELMLSGGTSGGAMAIGIVLYGMASATLSVIMIISFLAVLL